MKLKHLGTNVQNPMTYFFYLWQMSVMFWQKWNRLGGSWTQRFLIEGDFESRTLLIVSLFWTPALLDAVVRGRRRPWTTPFEDAVIRGRLIHCRHCSRSPLFEGDMHLDEMILKIKSVGINHKWTNGGVNKYIGQEIDFHFSQPA